MLSTDVEHFEQGLRPNLLVLDIDETLLHASIHKLDLSLDYKATRTYIYKRPYVDEFIEYCFNNFRVAVWTTAGAQFAEEIFSAVYPVSDKLEFIWSLEHCSDAASYSDYKIKDLSNIQCSHIKLNNIVMVDDTPEKLQLNSQNLIPIRPFYGDQSDRELLFLIQYLETIKLEEKIGFIDKRHWRLQANSSHPVSTNCRTFG